jgi:hypothetical protein
MFLKIQVFAAMFQANMRERNEGRVSIDDLSSSVLKKMIAFMYTGEAPDLLDTDDAIGLLEAAAKYEMDELKVEESRFSDLKQLKNFVVCILILYIIGILCRLDAGANHRDCMRNVGAGSLA